MSVFEEKDWIFFTYKVITFWVLKMISALVSEKKCHQNAQKGLRKSPERTVFSMLTQRSYMSVFEEKDWIFFTEKTQKKSKKNQQTQNKQLQVEVSKKLPQG